MIIEEMRNRKVEPNSTISEYAIFDVNKRIGVAAGKFKVPDDSFFYDEEIAESFEGLK